MLINFGFFLSCENVNELGFIAIVFLQQTLQLNCSVELLSWINVACACYVILLLWIIGVTKFMSRSFSLRIKINRSSTLLEKFNRWILSSGRSCFQGRHLYYSRWEDCKRHYGIIEILIMIDCWNFLYFVSDSHVGAQKCRLDWSKVDNPPIKKKIWFKNI